MSELPQGWIECALVDVGEIVTGNTPSKNVLENYGDKYPWVKPPDLGIDRPITETSEFLSEQGGKQARLLPIGSTLVSCIGILGKIGYAGTVLASNQQINSVVFDSRLVFSRYGFYFCKTLRPWLEENSSSTTVAIVNKGRFSLAPFTLPPLNEQSRIVAKLEEVLAKVNTSQKRLARIPVILKRFRQAVLAAACSGRLTADWREERGFGEGEELPEGWVFSTLRKLCSGFQYGTSAKSEPSGKVPVIRMGNIQNGKIDWSNLAYTSDAVEIEKYCLNSGDVLFNRTNSPELVGKTAIYRGEQPAIFAGYLIKIKNGAMLDSEYLNFCLNSSHAKEWCQQVKTDGVSQSNINAQKLADYEINLPPLPEQQEIVRRVESFFTLADQLEARYQKAKTHVNKLTQSILAKAFRGELVPQDPSDEPASVLLARIKSQRDVAPASGKKKVLSKKQAIL